MANVGLTAFLDVRKEDFVSMLGVVMSVIAIVDFIYFLSFRPMFSCYAMECIALLQIIL